MPQFNLLRRTFVRQRAESDCGVACLAMLLNYCGKTAEAIKLQRSVHPIPPEGLSLTELRDLAALWGMTARCVEMDPEFLRTADRPCILHVEGHEGNGHFEVFYGARRKQRDYCFLMADPATLFYELPEELLIKKWKSKAALYFDELTANLEPFKGDVWWRFVTKHVIPPGLLVSIPVLHSAAAAAGLCLTLVVQQVFIHHTPVAETHFWSGAAALLTVIHLFRTGCNLARQHLMIRVQTAIRQKLASPLLENTALNRQDLMQGLADVHVIGQGMNAMLFIVLSEGFIIVLLLVILFVLSVIAGTIMFGLLSGMLFYASRKTPLICYQLAHAANLLAAFEEKTKAAPPFQAPVLSEHYHHYSRFISTLDKQHGFRLLMTECLAGTGVTLVFVYALAAVKYSAISYLTAAAIIIISAFAASLAPRVCSQLAPVRRASDALQQLRAKFTDPEHLPLSYGNIYRTILRSPGIPTE